MKQTFLTVFVLILTTSIAGLAAAKEQNDNPKWCRACHQQARFSAKQFAATVHYENTCRDCHANYQFNPHEKVKSEASEESKAVAKYAKKDPSALAACHDCHDEFDAGKFSHGAARAKRNAAKGKDGKPGKKAATVALKKPYCLDCHGDPHTIMETKKMDPRKRRQAMNHRCLNCHGNKAAMKKAGIDHDIAHTYEDSIHARKLALGASLTPGCVDCHGGHKQLDVAAGMVEACKKCHEHATPDFAGLVSHKPIKAKVVSYYTQKFFAWLTFITILLLSLHVLLDLFSVLRLKFGASAGSKE